MFKKLMREKYFCGLDIGSHTVKASLIRIQDDHTPALLGVYESKTTGFYKDSVLDIGELSECIHRVVSGLSQKTSVKVSGVYLGVGGGLIDKRFSTAVIALLERGSKVISPRDIRKVQAQARLLGTDMDEYILHDLPQCYKVDDVNTAKNPVGLSGRKLQVTSLIVVVNNTLVNNLNRAVHQAGYEVEDLYFSSFSSAEMALSDYQKKQGCVALDIGCAMTNILIYRDGLLKVLANEPVGGEHFTRSLAKTMNLSFELAEDIKTSYAMTSNYGVANDEEILIKQEDGYLPIKKEVICQAIEPVVRQLEDRVLEVIQASGLSDQINTGILMLGGGALLPGLPERIEARTHQMVKLGKVNIAMKRLHNTVKFSAVIGLGQAGASRVFRREHFVPAGPGSWRQMLVSRVKEVYQEYF